MKKIYITLCFTFCAVFTTLAADYIVSGGPTYINGNYYEAGIYNGKPYYKNYDFNSYISWSGTRWEIGDGCCGGNIIMYECINTSTSTTCPTTGWSCSGLVVSLASDHLKYGSKTIMESPQNDGSFNESISIKFARVSVGQNFTGANGEDYAANGKVIFTNVPAGLTAHAIKKDTVVTLSFSGNAVSHTHLDEAIVNIVFTNSAFALDTAANVKSYSDSIEVLFRQVLTVAPSGADFTVISDAIAASSTNDVIDIWEGTYTEYNLTATHGIVFKGAGADKTIIQADVTPNTATDRVFNISGTGEVRFLDLTIQNGKLEAGNPYGAGIYSASSGVTVIIKNCRIVNNTCHSPTNYQAQGAGIHARNLQIFNSEISGNNITSSGQNYGAGIYTFNIYIENTTVTGNSNGPSTTGIGAGIYCLISFEIINCTVTNNNSLNTSTAAGFEGSSNGTSRTALNSIFYGNIGGGVDLILASGAISTNCIIGTKSGSFTEVGTVSGDPLLSALTNNGGTTNTHAIQAGSPAINAGLVGDKTPATDQRGLFHNNKRDIGAYEYDGLSCSQSIINISISICNEDSVLLSGAYQNTTGVYYDTLFNQTGCDSVIVTTLTVLNPSISTDVHTACESFTWIDGNNYTSSNNTATQTFVNALGCDSVVTLDLTIHNSTFGTDVQTACESFTWIDGNNYTSNNTTATHTLLNTMGCDSIVTLNLTIHNSTFGTDVQTACESFTWIDGNNYIANNSTATHTLVNAMGCDSIVTLNLTIHHVAYSYDTTKIIVSDPKIIPYNSALIMVESDTINLGLPCDSISIKYLQFEYAANYCTDTIIVTDTVLVTVTDTLVIDIPTGMPFPNNSNTILVYPNPAQDYVIIDNGNYSLLSSHQLEIVNSTGQQMFISSINTQTFNVNIASWAPGIYYVNIINQSSQIIDVRKLVLH